MQKSSQKSTPKVVGTPENTTSDANCLTSETSVSKKHGQSKLTSVQKYSQNSTPKVVSTCQKPAKSCPKGLTSETSV